jgi:MoxR-like ATPase
MTIIYLKYYRILLYLRSKLNTFKVYKFHNHLQVKEKQKNKMKERIQSLLREINKGIYEKETELSLALLAALAGESIILLGPPGVAKSMVARRLKSVFKDARSFEYLMSRFSTPDEIFGPVSISKLKNADRYERNTDGYLPSADVVFLDEIWKAGPAIQNTLLTVINEKLFRNGDKEVKLPLKLLISASNELPAQGEGLEALWDRFIIRIECANIKNDRNFSNMLLDTDSEKDIKADCSLQISDEEYQKWTKEIANITVPEYVVNSIIAIRKGMGNVPLNNSDERHNVYISDRRWKNIIRLLRASAFIHDRDSVEIADLVPIYHCLWQEPEETEGIREIVIKALLSEYAIKIADIKHALESDIRIYRQHRATIKATKDAEQEDADKKIFDSYYHHLVNHDTGNTYIYITDYKNMRRATKENAGQLGVIYKDSNKRTIIRCYNGADTPPDAKQAYLTRDKHGIYINGVYFEIEKLGRNERQTILKKTGMLSGRDYHKEIDAISNLIRKRKEEISDNILISPTDKKVMDTHVATLNKELAFLREDTEKLEE